MFLLEIEGVPLWSLLSEINNKGIAEDVIAILPPDIWSDKYRAIYKADVLGEIIRSLKQMGSVTQQDSAVDEDNVK